MLATTGEHTEYTTKQRFVIEAYRLLEANGMEGITVRDIAEHVGCTAAALYKHFESLDYLLMLASIRFLDDYVRELVSITRDNENPLLMEIKAWRCFNRYAFKNPPIYLHLFWSPANLSFEDAMSEYLMLFPLERHEERGSEDFYGYFYSAMFTGSIRERDFIWLRRAAADGFMDIESARDISEINDCIVHAKLMDHIGDYLEPGMAEQAARDCDHLIEKNMEPFV